MELENLTENAGKSFAKITRNFKKNPILLVGLGGVVVAGVYTLFKSRNTTATDTGYSEDTGSSSGVAVSYPSGGGNADSVSESDFEDLVDYVNSSIKSQTDYMQSLSDAQNQQAQSISDSIAKSNAAIASQFQDFNNDLGLLTGQIQNNQTYVQQLQQNQSNYSDALAQSLNTLNSVSSTMATINNTVGQIQQQQSVPAKATTTTPAKTTTSAATTTAKTTTTTPAKTTTSTAKTTGISYTGNSIVDALKSVGADSSMSARKDIAADLGIKNYTGTAAQNTQILNTLKKDSSVLKK